MAVSAPPDTRIIPTTSLTYWTSTPATISGMLGGYPQISRADLKGSANFLAKIQRLFPPSSSSPSSTSPPSSSLPPPKLLKRGVDCGAGIGRVTAGFLSTVCEEVDIVEPVEKFANEARDSMKVVGPGRIGNVYVTGLQDWVPPLEGGERYDLIWVQWCLGHLTDREVVEFLERCERVLVKGDGDGDGKGGGGGGWIVVKENLSTDKEGRDVFDEGDSSVTRTDEKWRILFEEAGVRLVKTDLQRGFPRELLPVRFYALRP